MLKFFLRPEPDPVTGEKALFVNPQFSRRIVGLKIEESDAILNLLYAHIAQGADFQVRIRWKPKSVVLWDSESSPFSFQRGVFEADAGCLGKRQDHGPHGDCRLCEDGREEARGEDHAPGREAVLQAVGVSAGGGGGSFAPRGMNDPSGSLYTCFLLLNPPPFVQNTRFRPSTQPLARDILRTLDSSRRFSSAGDPNRCAPGFVRCTIMFTYSWERHEATCRFKFEIEEA